MKQMEGMEEYGEIKADPHSQAILLLVLATVTTPRPKLEAVRLGSDRICCKLK